MSGFNFLRGTVDKQHNLPRVRLTEVVNNHRNACVATELKVEMLFIDMYQTMDNSGLTLFGLRSQRLFWSGEKSLALMMNYIHGSYSNSGGL